MSQGFELKSPTGTDVWMSSDNFGLMVADVFEISPNTSGTQTYSNLNWHNVIYAQQVMNISGDVYSRSMTSHAFVNITISVNSNNIPTISWSPHNVKTACLGGNNDDTTSYTEATGNSNEDRWKHPCFGGNKTPDLRIVVMVG